ncbi:MAG: biosynthetic-type acetolactate synthase large subunit [Candidatus Ratteibacteria bacterium]|nr:biosynthetic-type acetolactate synthase large subunit [Candidatus Ratteibacteria bacterium]
MTGAEIVVKSLRKEGVDIIFGYPGGVLLPLCDHLYDSDIKVILVRHEQGAAHAADGYARSSGRVGVCMATSGPGATNLVTGIATAYMDSIPLVAITGQVATHLIGSDAFQEVDITGITRPITKHNYLVKNVNDIAITIKEAFYIASSGRPGPVLIDLPVDVQRAEGRFEYPESVEIRSYKPTYEGHPLQIEKAWKTIKEAKKPLLLVGGGVIASNASDELRSFIDNTGIPAIFTLMGLGSVPIEHPLALGMLGMHGTKYANYAVIETDLLIAVGCRFDDRITGDIKTFAPHAKIIHIDIDPSSISKNIVVDIPIVGDAKNILIKLCEKAEKLDIEPWVKKIKEWKKRYPLTYDKNGLKPQYIIEKLSSLLPDDAIICTEVGQNQMWTAQYYKFRRPRTLITSGGLGTMGFGFPAAIGAQVANPEKIVVDIAGDGSIQMNIQELATAVYNKLPVKIIILNNCCLGMVRQWQQLFYKKRYAYTCLKNAEPDFVKLADAYGAVGYKVTSPEEFDKIIPKVLEEKERPVLVDCRICEEENVFPMVPAGESLDRILEGLA